MWESVLECGESKRRCGEMCGGVGKCVGKVWGRYGASVGGVGKVC